MSQHNSTNFYGTNHGQQYGQINVGRGAIALFGNSEWPLKQYSPWQLARKNGKERERLLRLLSTVQYDLQHANLHKLRYKKTGDWVLGNKKFVDWRSASRSSCLRCHGIPGSGKTILTSRIIDHLQPKADGKASALSFHYCDYADPQTLNASKIIGTFVRQLLMHQQVLPEHIAGLLVKAYQCGRIPTTDELGLILSQSASLYPQSFIIIDGLDECEEATQVDVLKALHSVLSNSGSIVSIYVSSREASQISAVLKGYPRIQMSENKLSGDIAAFVDGIVTEKLNSGELKIRESSLKYEIISTLIDKAHGMFLWVSFQIVEICEPTQSDDGIRKTLSELPIGLHNTYIRLASRLERKGPRVMRVVRKILKWIMFGRRLLTLDEMREVVAFDIGDASWNGAKIRPDEDGEDLIKICGNLVVIDKVTTAVRLAHHTVQQFLLHNMGVVADAGNDTGVYNHLRFAVSDSEVEIGHLCATYLMFSDFNNALRKFKPKRVLAHTGILAPDGMSHLPEALSMGSGVFEWLYWFRGGGTDRSLPYIDYSATLQQIRPKDTASFNKKYRLLNYVVEYWIQHCRFCNPGQTEFWCLFQHLTLEKSLAFEFRDWGSSPGPVDLPYLPLFQWALRNGHAPLLRLFLEGRDEPNLEDYCAYEAQHAIRGILEVCRRGYLQVLELLFGQGTSQFPLSLSLHQAILAHVGLVTEALQFGHETCADYLINQGANVNDHSKSGETALHCAARAGFDKLVQKLVERGVDVNARASRNETPLHIAAAKGHDAVASILLEWELELDPVDDDGETPFSLALGIGNRAILCLLIDAAIASGMLESAYEQFKKQQQRERSTRPQTVESWLSVASRSSVSISDNPLAFLSAKKDIDA